MPEHALELVDALVAQQTLVLGRDELLGQVLRLLEIGAGQLIAPGGDAVLVVLELGEVLDQARDVAMVVAADALIRLRKNP